MKTCVPLFTAHKHVSSHRQDIVSPYGLDSNSKVALMFILCKLDHHGA